MKINTIFQNHLKYQYTYWEWLINNFGHPERFANMVSVRFRFDFQLMTCLQKTWLYWSSSTSTIVLVPLKLFEYNVLESQNVQWIIDENLVHYFLIEMTVIRHSKQKKIILIIFALRSFHFSIFFLFFLAHFILCRTL